ncbi:Uncharacterised protein [Neisseria zoodegmatis]|uniref:Uncharacterized protein n=1 Tax=Neisseria zoodegmatis TaxID=326523 RepID=A0A378WIY4_9NEIS|nr:hypothetical protein [Neisseria zoodegmatis]SUA36685.1 Uncharacterised protein [Neisseria zoodegmatis]
MKKIIKNKRIMFSIKMIIVYWILHLILISIIGKELKFMIIDLILLFPTNFLASSLMDSILLFFGFTGDLSQGPQKFYYGEILRKFLYFLFSSVHIFILSYCASFFLYTKNKPNWK